MESWTDADAELAWQLQQEECSGICGTQNQQSWQNNHSSSATGSSCSVQSDEQLAQDISDRQLAYGMQVEEDEVMAQAMEQDHRGHGGHGHRGQGRRDQGLFVGSFIRALGLVTGQPQGMLQDSMSNSYESLLNLAERLGEGRNPGLETNELDALPTQIYRVPHQGGSGGVTAEDNQCKVCLEDFDDGDDLRTLPCCHKYHKICIDKWLQRKATCPVCKLEVKEQLRNNVPQR